MLDCGYAPNEDCISRDHKHIIFIEVGKEKENNLHLLRNERAMLEGQIRRLDAKIAEIEKELIK